MDDFKTIADDVMSDIQVTASLKAKTLARCRKKQPFTVAKYLVPAACLLLIFSVMRLTGPLNNNRAANPGNNTEINILMASPEKGQENVQDSSLSTLDEASKLFGSGFLSPSYIPEGFMLGVVSPENISADSVVLQYVSLDKEFLVIEQKTENPVKLPDDKEVTINDATGWLKSDNVNDKENPYTELYWYVKGVQYSITGSITEKEAMNIALSMK